LQTKNGPWTGLWETLPYAITVKEVDDLSRQTLANRGFILNTNLNNIKSVAFIEDNQLVIIFQKPILDKSKQYHLDQAIAIPVFVGNEVHILDIDATHIAISKSGSKYIPMGVEEYNLCMERTPTNVSSIKHRGHPMTLPHAQSEHSTAANLHAE
jgi:hypothetical protein